MPPAHALVKPHPDHTLSPPPALTLQGHMGTVYCAAFSPDGRYIVSGSQDNMIRFWDAQTGDIAPGPPERHTSSVECLAFSPDGRQIASGSYDTTILVWDVGTRKVVAGPFIGHTDAIHCVSFSPNGKWIASGSRDKTIQVWDGDLVIGCLTGHTDWVRSVAFSKDGTRLVSGSVDKTVRVWSVGSGQLIYGPLRGHTNFINFVAFSHDGKRIVSADGDVSVWDADTGALMSGPSKQHEEGTLTVGCISSSTDNCAVSPNGQWIAATGSQRTVKVWHSKTGLLVTTFSDHTDWVYSVSFSPDSMQLLTASRDRTIRVHTLHHLLVDI